MGKAAQVSQNDPVMTGVRRLCVAAAFVAVGVLGSACVNTVAGDPIRAKDAAPWELPPLAEADLDEVLLSIGELNGIVGSTGMTITAKLEKMSDHSDQITNLGCLGAIYGAEAPVYGGSGWTAMRDEVAREPGDDNEHWVEQAAVLFPTAAQAQEFFDKSTTTWQKCVGEVIEVEHRDASKYTWKMADVVVGDKLISQKSAQRHAGGWACQHAMSAVSNLIVETWACGYGVNDEAASIATEIVANVAER
jgi:hypothetical protein